MNESVKSAIRSKADEEPFARKLGLRLVDFDDGYARVEMNVTEDLTNILGMLHGGAIFSLVDEAFQIGVNASGTTSVALNMSISYLKSARIGDRLTAEAREIQSTRKTAHYEVQVTDQEGRLIACSHATAYRKNESLPFLSAKKGRLTSDKHEA
jgi:acyl-CoA thioesterase